MKALLSQLKLQSLLPRVFTGWCIAAWIETLLNPHGFATLDFLSAMVLWRFLLTIAVVTAALTVVALKYNIRSLETALLCGAAFLYLMTLAYYEHNFWFSLGLTCVMAFVLLYAFRRDRLGSISFRPDEHTAAAIIAIAAVIFAAYSGAVTVCRHLAFNSSTFDLGIFAQMFHYMKETGLPLTTCERDGLVSHFAVHVSPIWYLLLPGYMIFDSPVYLQIMQALTLAGGVIPLYLLSRHLGQSTNTRLFLCLAYCFFPALTGGQFYDVHENMFLTPLLLWLFYFYEKRKLLPVCLFALLTLAVKEDAAIYIAAIALYMLLSRRDYKLGLPLLAAAVIYFVTATALLAAFGDGVMTASRFGAYFTGEGGMADVVKTVFKNPAYLFEQIFTVEKIQFLLMMLLPLCGLSVCSKDISKLTLLIPVLLVNIMPNWPYQYSVHFQYVFGSIAVLVYLAVINVQHLPAVARRVMLPMAVSFALILSMAHMSQFSDNITSCIQNTGARQTINTALSQIPADASVVAHGYMVPALADREVIYDYSTGKTAEYIVLDLRPGRESGAEEARQSYAANPERYVCIALHEQLVAIYCDTQYVPQ